MPESTLVTQWGSSFLRGRFRLVRNTFAMAGVDSFSDPPAQNPDMFEVLTNVVPPVQGDIDRRWGYGLQTPGVFSSLTGLPTAATIGLYQNTQSGNRQYVYAAGAQPIVATNEAGQITNPGVFTPVASPPSPVRMLNSRSYGYFADGATADYKKWDGQTGVSKWGIDINQVAGLIVGPNGPGTAADQGGSGAVAGSAGPNSPSVDASDNSIGGATWSDSTGNPLTADGRYSQSHMNSVTSNTQYLKVTGYGFAIPALATITGIVVKALVDAGDSADNSIRLYKAGVLAGTDHAVRSNLWPSAAPGYIAWGGNSDLWGTTWTPTDINNAGFGAAISATNETVLDSPAIANVDYVSITVYYTTPSAGSWTNPNNILAQDGAVATASVTTSPTSELRATNFGIVPGGANGIAGIQVDIKVSAIGGTPNLQPILVKSAATYGLRKTSPVATSSLGFISFGGPTDLWGGAWANADINSTNFGVQFLAATTSGTATINVDYVQITVYSITGAAVLGAPTGGGAITLSVGRQYAIAFENSVTGQVSDITLFTASTGPLTNQNQPLSSIPVSLDAQVDKKVLVATADGGDQTTLYFITELLNATTTYTDSTTETNLLLANVYLNQDVTGALLGVADNVPPPVGAINPVKHRGRVYMHTPTSLYYSKAEADLVTSSATLTGKFEECWPGLNYFDISAGAETNRGLLSDGQVLYIGTDKRIVRLFGDGPSNFSQPESLFQHTGIANQDVWKIVFIEGNPLGAMWLTPDRRVLGSDFNTYQDVGLPVQNILDSVNQAVFQQVSWAAYVGISNWNLYILAIPTGFNTQPDTLLIFDLKGKKWYIWQPTDLMLGGIYNISIGGIPHFITMANTGVAYNWDPTLLQDRVGNTPVNFTVTMQTSWQDFTDAAARKFLNEIEVVTGDKNLVVSIDGASTRAKFASPNSVISGAALSVKPRGEFFVPLAGKTTRDRFYRFKFVSTSNGTDLIRGYNIEGGVIHRL